MKNISNVVEKIKTHILCSIIIFRKSSFNEMVWKNLVEPDRPQIAMLNGACALRAGYVLCALNLLCHFFPLLCQLFSNVKAQVKKLGWAVTRPHFEQ